MKYLLYGHNNWIGTHVKELLNTPILCNIDLEEYDDLRKEVLTIYPDRIIYVCDNDNNLYTNLKNYLQKPLNISKICCDNKIHFTYINCGDIFNNNNNYSFIEYNKSNIKNSELHIIKGMVDQLIRNKNTLNIRLRMPIVEYDHINNFIYKIIKNKKVCDIQNSMSVLPELLPNIIGLLNKGIIGTINFTNPGSISVNEILHLYKDIIDNDLDMENMENEKFQEFNCNLDTIKLQNLCPNIKNIKDSIIDILKNYKYIKF